MREILVKYRRVVGIVFCCFLAVWPAFAQDVRILQQVEDTLACKKWVEERLSKMSLKQKIGQLFIHTVAPVTVQWNKDNIKKAVEDYEVGGLLFSGGSLEKQIELTEWAQGLADIPLFITFDGEWGLAMRLKGTPDFPRNRVLGCIRNDTLIYHYGREVARELREIGVQINFAPVADVDNNPKNPVINTRSFGSSPQAVADKVVAYSRGLEDGGVLAVCKHFPGHGDTEADSHKTMPVLPFDRARLDSVELVPFKKAIASGVGGIMTGHLNVPSLAEKPASISPEITGGLLQNELKFSGLTFTDALEMKGVSGNSDLCVQALIAGNDLLLAPRNLKREIAGVVAAVKDGRLSEELITEKCRKVLTYKYALGLSRRVPIDTSGIRKRIHTLQTDRLLRTLERAAVTVVKDSAEMLPLDMSLSGTVLLSVSSSLTEAAPFYQGLKRSTTVTWMRADADSLKSLEERIRPAQQVIVALHTKDYSRFIPLINRLAADKPLALVCFGPSSWLNKMLPTMEKVSAVVLAHSDKDYIQHYVASAITGKARVDGRLSVPLGEKWPAGTGVILDPNSPRDYSPEDFYMDSSVLSRIDSIAEEGIRGGAYPGCHVLIMKEGYTIYNKCFGNHTYEGTEKVRENDMYDLASLSKVTGTLLAVMKLYDEGKIGLTDKIGRYVPAMRGTDKENITIQELLFHESGLPSYLPFYEETIDKKTCKGGFYSKRRDSNHRIRIGSSLYICTNFSFKPEWISKVPSRDYPLKVADGLFIRKEFKENILKQIAETPLKSRSYRYSCLNFMLLKEMIESVTGTGMDVYLDSVFYKPMGLQYTMYNPLRRVRKERIVPSVEDDFLRGGPLRGFVHDEAAAFLGGVSGNAGLFSTAHEVATIFQMLLNRGVYGDRRYLSRATCDLFLEMKSENSRRGLGFDKPDAANPDNSPCAKEAPASVFGHTGFTGTCAWADPDNKLVYVFLSNRIYPQVYGRSALMRLDIRSRIQQVMYQALMPQ